MDDLRWVVGLNLVLAIWIGMLADTWKGRRSHVWMVIGFTTSLFGLALLAWLPKVSRSSNVIGLGINPDYEATHSGYRSDAETASMVAR